MVELPQSIQTGSVSGRGLPHRQASRPVSGRGLPSMNNTHTRALVRPTFSPRASVPPPELVGFSRAWGQVLCESLPCPQAHLRRAK